MTKYDHAISAACRDIEGGNNGYADIGNHPGVIAGVIAAGYVVIAAMDLFGRPTHRGFTRRAQEALRTEAFGISTCRDFSARHDTPDYEGAILARQEARD